MIKLAFLLFTPAAATSPTRWVRALQPAPDLPPLAPFDKPLDRPTRFHADAHASKPPPSAKKSPATFFLGAQASKPPPAKEKQKSPATDFLAEKMHEMRVTLLQVFKKKKMKI